MPMSADQWRAWDHTAAYLQALQYQASMMTHHAREMHSVLEMMKERPNFVTLTEESLVTLGKQLDTLQTAYRIIAEGYANLPVIINSKAKELQ